MVCAAAATALPTTLPYRHHLLKYTHDVQKFFVIDEFFRGCTLPLCLLRFPLLDVDVVITTPVRLWYRLARILSGMFLCAGVLLNLLHHGDVAVLVYDLKRKAAAWFFFLMRRASAHYSQKGFCP